MGRPRSASKRTERFVSSASVHELEEFKKACAKIDLEPADTLRKLANGFTAHVNEHGTFTFPIKFLPEPKSQAGA